MKQLPHIGTVELISLPGEGIQGIPAKIDTGADSSAIWASNIHIKDGKLHFNFFARGSAYYREEPVVTTAFKTTSIKNSFGHEESRYKVRLQVSIGEHTLTRWFSLADRSNNTYPILLGKNLLNRRFVVDVSKRYLLSKGATKQSVLIVGAQKSGDFFKQVKRQNSLDVDYDVIGYGPLCFYIDGMATKVTASGKDIADYGLTYFKSHNQNTEFALAAATYLHFKGRPFIDRELQAVVSASKLTEYMKLACFDLPVPASLCAKTETLKKEYAAISRRLGVPFVLKEIRSDRGRNNYLISSRQDLTSVLKKSTDDQVFLAQRYIENDGFLRLYVMGKETVLAVFREPHAHSDPLKMHLNKPSGSDNAKQLDLEAVPLEVREMAVRAAACLSRQIAGVDLIQDKHTSAWYILEANNGPQLRSGSFVAEKSKALAKFFDKELRR